MFKRDQQNRSKAKRLSLAHRLVLVTLLLTSMLPSPAVLAEDSPAINEAVTSVERDNQTSEESAQSESSALPNTPTGNLLDDDEDDGNLANGLSSESSEHSEDLPQTLEPKIDYDIKERAHYQYVADPDMDAGAEEVVEEAVHAGRKTTTTYKKVTTPDVDLGPGVEEALKSDKYMYSDEKIYSVDYSQKTPSEQIVIDKLFVSVPATQNLGPSTGVRELAQSDTTLIKPTEGTYKGYTLTTDMLDPNNPAIRTIKYRTKVTGTDKWEEVDFSRDEDLYKVMLEKSFKYLIGVTSGAHVERLIPLRENNLVTREDAVRRYFAKNTMSDALYADVKANYQRLQLASEKLEAMGKTDALQKWMASWGELSYKLLGRRYDYVNGYDTFSFHYHGEVPQETREAFESLVKDIPFEYRKNMVYTVVTDQQLPSVREDAVGSAYPPTGHINLRYITTFNGKELSQPEWYMLKTLLHEIGHLVDYNAGIFGSSEYEDVWDYVNSRYNIVGFSHTQEFEALYNAYVKDQKAYPDHYTESTVEAFAEFFAVYVAKKVFNWEYSRYKIVDGELVLDPKGFSPMDKLEPYFANLYHQLFEPAVRSKIVVDTITTEEKELKHGLIKVGVRPEEEFEDLDYETEERLDNTLEQGQRQVLQAGVNGQVRKLTTYKLVNTETGEMSSEVTRTVVKPMVKEIIRVGTKPPFSEAKGDQFNNGAAAVASELPELSIPEEASSSQASSESSSSASQEKPAEKPAEKPEQKPAKKSEFSNVISNATNWLVTGFFAVVSWVTSVFKKFF